MNLRNIKITLIFFLIIHGLLWTKTHTITPKLAIVPNVPTSNQARAMAFGDEQGYFRYLALYIQNAGDTFGRFTALKEYDYKLLSKWFILLDQLDAKSNFIPAIVSYYYSNTQNTADNIYLVEYLEQHYDRNPAEKWWWLGQAIMIAKNKLNDAQLALRLAYKLAATPNRHMPKWAYQMPAFILEDLGEKEQALAIIQDLATKYNDYTPQELNFMQYFIHERLGFLKEELKHYNH